MYRETEKERRDRIRRAKDELVLTLEQMGYPPEFGRTVADQLGHERAVRRMISYLRQVKPGSIELVVDEMLSIISDRDAWIRKKQARYYNAKYNEILYYGLDTDDD